MVKYAKLFPPNIAMHCWQKSEVGLPKLAKILTFQWLQCQKLLEVVLEEEDQRIELVAVFHIHFQNFI